MNKRKRRVFAVTTTFALLFGAAVSVSPIIANPIEASAMSAVFKTTNKAKAHHNLYKLTGTTKKGNPVWKKAGKIQKGQKYTVKSSYKGGKYSIVYKGKSYWVDRASVFKD